MKNIVMLRERIMDHANLDEQKKMILAVNYLSYFPSVNKDNPNLKIARQMNCSEELAQQYKDKYLLIDWTAERSEENVKNIDAIIDIVSSIMNWQWEQRNQSSSEQKPERSGYRM